MIKFYHCNGESTKVKVYELKVSRLRINYGTDRLLTKNIIIVLMIILNKTNMKVVKKLATDFRNATAGSNRCKLSNSSSFSCEPNPSLIYHNSCIIISLVVREHILQFILPFNLLLKIP